MGEQLWASSETSAVREENSLYFMCLNKRNPKRQQDRVELRHRASPGVCSEIREQDFGPAFILLLICFITEAGFMFLSVIWKY